MFSKPMDASYSIVLTYEYKVATVSARMNLLLTREPEGTLNVIVVVRAGSSVGSSTN